MMPTEMIPAEVHSTRIRSDRRLHILVVTDSYAPDQSGMAPLNTELCEHLASRGHRVSVATGFPHYPNWKVPEAYRRKLWQRETHNGVTIHRGYIFVPAQPTTVRRILYDASIGLSTALRGLPIRNVDLVLAVSPPLQAGLAGYLLARLKGAPLVFQIKDLVPDLAVALGMLRNRWAIRLARALENSVYRRADTILVICEGFRANLLAKGVPESKISLIPDWVNTRFIRPITPPDGFRRTHNLGDAHFLILHTGNMGAKQKLENALAAAAELREEQGILFCLVGDGAEKNGLQEYARSLALSNVRFLPLQAREALPGMLSAADVLLLNQSAQLVDMVIPSKLLLYMAAGRPVVASVATNSEAAQCIRRASCGLVVEPENPTALAEAIRLLYANRSLADCLGARGRLFAEQHFASDHVFHLYENLFLSLSKKKRKMYRSHELQEESKSSGDAGGKLRGNGWRPGGETQAR